eukprot:jgi/Tetstr1/451001/TSEL_038037.t1
MPAFGQEIDETLVSPVPPPRPAEFGGTSQPGDSEDGARPDAAIDGVEPGTGPDRLDFSGITDPQPVTLSARLTDDGPFIPEGLVWRVFDTRTDETGELALVAKSEDATASLSLPPGEYITHVGLWARSGQRYDVRRTRPQHPYHRFRGRRIAAFAMIAGDVPIPSDLLRFDIYSNGPNGRVTVAENVAANELIHLNAGIYSITSRFGSVNAVVRSELRVEPGQITEATLYQKAAQVSLRLVSEEGGEAIADVEWTIKTPQGETIFSDIGAFPATVLAEGDYLALAKLGENVYNREFEVTAGSPREIEILTTVY